MAASVHQGFKKGSQEKPVLFTQGFTQMSRNEHAQVRHQLFISSAFDSVRPARLCLSCLSLVTSICAFTARKELKSS